MRTLWLALCALARLWPGTLAGCAEAGRCCPGRDAACFVRGWRLDRVYGTCFCDQACRLTGDCCFDYARACPGGWRGRGWGAGPLPAANGHTIPHQGPQLRRQDPPAPSIPACPDVYPGLPLPPPARYTSLHSRVRQSFSPRCIQLPASWSPRDPSLHPGPPSFLYPKVLQPPPSRDPSALSVLI